MEHHHHCMPSHFLAEDKKYLFKKKKTTELYISNLSRLQSKLLCNSSVSKPVYFNDIFKRFYLFIFRERGREGERQGEKQQCVLPLEHPLVGTWPTTQACALTGNQT